jgi:hypothetical protein
MCNSLLISSKKVYTRAQIPLCPSQKVEKKSYNKQTRILVVELPKQDIGPCLVEISQAMPTSVFFSFFFKFLMFHPMQASEDRFSTKWQDVSPNHPKR